MILKFGGHAMVAGLSLEEAQFERFQQRFGELVTEWLIPPYCKVKWCRMAH